MSPRIAFALVCSGLSAGCGLFVPVPNVEPDVDAGSLPVDAGVTPAAFTLTAFDRATITSLGGEPNFQKVEAEIDWGSAPKARVTLAVDLESPCYPFTKWLESPPPAGHNWPEACDAYDRNFSFVLDPPAAAGAEPGFELVRAITPFGGPQYFELDLTDLANARPGKHRLRATISTWPDGAGQVSGSKGSWIVTAHLIVEPGPPPRNVLAAIPLYDGSHTQAGDGPELPFALPEGTVAAVLEYRATGHGGGPADAACIGHADEFCKRLHTLEADGAQALSFQPWREDCADFCTLSAETDRHPFGGRYCLENPNGSIDSVRAPRANWCPGAVTLPEVIEPPAWRSPGTHRFRWNIDQIAAGGSWRISAIVYAYGG